MKTINMRTSCLTFFLLVFSSVLTQAQSIDRVRDLIESGEYLDAAKMLRPLADGGDAEAQVIAAGLFFEGKGVEKNDEQGIRYATMAAQQGSEQGVKILLDYYEEKGDYSKSFEFLEKLIGNHPYLKKEPIGVLFASMYLIGKGTEQDDESGWSILEKNDAFNDLIDGHKKIWYNYGVKDIEDARKKTIESLYWKYLLDKEGLSPKQYDLLAERLELRDEEKYELLVWWLDTVYYYQNPTELDLAAQNGSKWANKHIADDKPAEFPGGEAALLEYLKKNIKYPAFCRENNIKGRVIVSFVINNDGKIVNPEVINSVHPSLDKEALRVVSSMPNWKPGRQKGKIVRVKYNLPITFR